MAALGCGKPKIPRPQPSIKIAVEGEGTPTINRDANGDPLSVVVRVYHLKKGDEFAKLTFDQFISGRTDQELLGEDFIGRSEFVIVPGTISRQTADLTGGTNYIGVVAFFRKPDPNYWRYLVTMEQLKMARTRRKDWPGKKLPLLSFKVQDCFMTLNHCQPEWIPGQPQNAKPDCGGYFVSPPIPAVKGPETAPPPAKTAPPRSPSYKPLTHSPRLPLPPPKTIPTSP